MISPALPSFIIIGAAKAATTWITYQLRQIPEVYLPGPEPHFFSTEFHRGVGWYEDFFKDARDGQIVGEKSADYLAHPEAPRRIAQILPNVQIVVQLRNPIERAYSDYCMFYRRGAVSDGPEYYLGKENSAIPRFMEDGLYYRHITNFLDFFSREQIKVVLYDDIRSQPEAIVQGISRHIGVEGAVAPVAPSSRVKTRDAPLLPLGLRRLLRPMKKMAEPWRGSAWFMATRSLLAKPVNYPPLTRDVRMRMRDYYAKDISGLERLTGRDLAMWLSTERPDN